MISDTLTILLISTFTALVSEGLTWLFVYRTENYQRLKAIVDKQTKILEKKKSLTADLSIDKNSRKRINKQEEKLKNCNRDLSFVKMKSMFVVTIIFTTLFNVLSTYFDGRSVAKLPFIPLSWFQGLSHRNLPGDDLTDCSFVFLYFICTMSMRQNVQKALGFTPARSSMNQNAFGQENPYH